MIIITRNLLTFRDSEACWANYTYCFIVIIVIVLLPVFGVEECGECGNVQFMLVVVVVVVRLNFKRVTLDPEVY